MRKRIIILLTCIFVFITCILSYFFYVKSYIKNSNWEHNLNCAVHQIYDRNYKLIGHTSIKNLKNLHINEIPDLLIKTIINIEDQSFYTNCGIDFYGIMRSILFLIPSIIQSQKPSGGSTITQQIVRQLFLKQNISFMRKFKELFYAIAFTKLYNKEIILSTYLNHSYLGYGAYGIATISQILFQKSVDDLNSAEIALLIALFNTPASKNRTSRIHSKQRYILEKMYLSKFISEAEYENQKNISFSLEQLTKNKNYITQEVREWIISNFGQSSYLNDNYQVITSIDSNIQNIAENVLRNNIISLDEESKWKGPIANGSLNDLNKFNVGRDYQVVLMIDTNGKYHNHSTSGILSETEIAKYIQKTGKIKVGDIVILTKQRNKLVNLPNLTGHITIIKATGEDAGDILASVGGIDIDTVSFDITRNAVRHPGSCVKIFSYLAAMEENISPDQVIKDAPGSSVGEKFIYDINPHNDQWIMNNWDNKFMGNITFYKALLESRNIPFMYVVLNQITMDKFRKYMLKYNLIQPNDDVYVSVILGNLNISPRNFASTVLPIANGGYKTDIHMIKHVKNNGLSVFHTERSTQQKEKPLFRRDSWIKLLDGLRGCVHDGRSRKISVLNIHNVYSKTGISGNNKDANCLGIVTTKQYGPIVIYVGICRSDFSEIGPHVFGSGYSVTMVKDIIKALEIVDVPLETIIA